MSGMTGGGASDDASGSTAGSIGGGAAKGAALGSVVPGFGTAIGAGVGALGGWLAHRHQSSKTDRGQYLQGQGNLQNLFNYGLDSGKAATNEAQNYNSAILTGNRATIAQAEAPEINAITGQADQAKKQQASMGTARTGGTSAANQQRQQQSQGEVSNLIAKARPEAARAQANLGGNLLGLGANAASTYTNNAAASLPGSQKQNEQQGQATEQISTRAGQEAGKLAAAHAFGF